MPLQLPLSARPACTRVNLARLLVPFAFLSPRHSYYDASGRRANNGSLLAPGARPSVDPLGALAPGAWEEAMVGQCKSALAVRPKKAHAVLFYSQVSAQTSPLLTVTYS